MLAFYRPFTARADSAALVPVVQAGERKGSDRDMDRGWVEGKERKKRERETGTSLVNLTTG